MLWKKSSHWHFPHCWVNHHPCMGVLCWTAASLLAGTAVMLVEPLISTGAGSHRDTMKVRGAER